MSQACFCSALSYRGPISDQGIATCFRLQHFVLFLCVTFERTHQDAPLGTLGLDSMEAMQLMALLEERFMVSCLLSKLTLFTSVVLGDRNRHDGRCGNYVAAARRYVCSARAT